MRFLAQAAPDAPAISPAEMLFVFLGGALLYLAIRLVRWGFPLIRLNRERRAWWARIAPLGELVLWMVYLVSVIAWTLQGYPVVRLIALGLLACVVVVALWFVIRDYLSGVILRTERVIELGDTIEIGTMAGQVRHLGTRGLELELQHGDRMFVPYRAVRESPIIRRRTQRSAVRRSFVVEVPSHLSPAQARVIVRRATLLNHWISPGHDPKISARDDHSLEVTVHALTDVRAADVEAMVREALLAGAPEPD